MSKSIDLVLLYGGKSGEHEISLISAASVLNHLNPNHYNIQPIGIDKDGCFYLNNYQELITYKDSLPVKTPSSVYLPSLLKDGRLAVHADVVFPIVHGRLYEDGCLQGVLELAGVAYVGCNVLASAIGMDKDIARRLVCDDSIQSAKYRVLSWHSNAAQRLEFCQQVIIDLGLPLFIKPCSSGSSVGISKANDLSQLQTALNDALRFDETVLVEEFIKGREIELAVLETIAGSPAVSQAGEIKVNHPDGFYSYTAKYLDINSTKLCAPAELKPHLLHQLQQLASDIFTRLKCKGMARVDFFVNDDTDTIYFNEINTLPGFTPMSMYPRLWQVSGLEYPELLDKLVGLALEHYQCSQQLITNYQ